MSVRERVNAALEQKRKDKVIGTLATARVALTRVGPVARLLDAHRDDLPMLFIVSDLELTWAAEWRRRVAVERGQGAGAKCERCWRFVPEVSSAPEFLGISVRVVRATLSGPVVCSEAICTRTAALRSAAARPLDSARHRHRRIRIRRRCLIRQSLAVHESITILRAFSTSSSSGTPVRVLGLIVDMDFPCKTAIVGAGVDVSGLCGRSTGGLSQGRLKWPASV